MADKMVANYMSDISNMVSDADSTNCYGCPYICQLSDQLHHLQNTNKNIIFLFFIFL